MKLFKAAVAVTGAMALIGSLLTNALASKPQPFGELKAPAQVKKFKVGGNLTVTGILHANANMSVYGGLYAHGGFQDWKGIIVHNTGINVLSGGISTDALTVASGGKTNLGGDTSVNGNLAVTSAIGAGTLSTTGAASIGGALTASGALTANGVNAGAAGLTTTGNINAGAGTISTSGSLTAGSIGAATLTAGTLTTTGGATLGSTGTTTTFNGTVDFSHATVTGIGTVGGTASTLTVGSASATSSPLTIAENNTTATIGVNTNGDLTISKGLVSSALTAPNGTGSSPGQLTLTGNPISLVGTTNLANGSDLSLTHSGATTSHVISNGDADVAGTLTVTVLATNTTGSATYTFAKPYGAAPVVVVTPASDPGDSRYWVTATQTNFTIQYTPATPPTSNTNLIFNYHVIGS